MLYLCFCPGLTKKTKLLFTSSNSSYNECVRNHSSSKMFSSLLQSNECEQDCEGQDLRNQNVILDASATHTFKSCSWKDCSGTKGPAISFQSKTGSSLTVDKCSFDSCTSTSSLRQDGGGAINAYNVKAVSIISSLFHSCKCTSTQKSGTGNNRSGGGMLLHSVTETPLVKMCMFISCEALDDAGGLGIFSCGSNINIFAVQDSQFISCYCNDSSGAFEFQSSTCKVCSSCLYCKCSSKSGGASFIRFGTLASLAAISFSLYKDNESNIGKDLYFDSATKGVIFHSFTTATDSGRVRFTTSSSAPDDWLPQGSIFLANSRSDGGYDNIDQSEYAWLDMIIFRIS